MNLVNIHIYSFERTRVSLPVGFTVSDTKKIVAQILNCSVAVLVCQSNNIVRADNYVPAGGEELLIYPSDRIYLRYCNGYVAVYLWNGTTVGELREHIASDLGLLPSEVSLVSGVKKLTEDSHTLAVEGVERWNTITAFFPDYKPSPIQVKFLVLDHSGSFADHKMQRTTKSPAKPLGSFVDIESVINFLVEKGYSARGSRICEDRSVGAYYVEGSPAIRIYPC